MQTTGTNSDLFEHKGTFIRFCKHSTAQEGQRCRGPLGKRNPRLPSSLEVSPTLSQAFSPHGGAMLLGCLLFGTRPREFWA